MQLQVAMAGMAPFVAGKTGASDDENDAWFVGFTNDVTVAVWVGYDSAASLSRHDRGNEDRIHYALLANRHHGLAEGVRSLLETTFDVVLMVADKISLFESATRLPIDLAVVDLALTRGEGIGLVRRLRDRCPIMKLIVVSVHDQPSASRSALEAGANGFVLKRAIATDLLPAVDAVLSGQRYVSPGC